MGDEGVDHAGEVHHLGLLDDVAQELPEQVITEGRDFGTGVIENVEQRIQELG